MPTEDEFRLVDRMLDELMVKHYEMATLCGEYRDLLADLAERTWDREGRRLASHLPGAKYHVAQTWAREQALKIQAELRRMFPPED
ncbi:MAG: hypothetical protein AB1416_03070 [Actinomycetota bacterium]